MTQICIESLDRGFVFDTPQNIQRGLEDGNYEKTYPFDASMEVVAHRERSTDSGFDERDIQGVLVHFGYELDRARVLRVLESIGLAPCSFAELLGFGMQFPLHQVRYPIVALDSVFKDLDDERQGINSVGSHQWPVLSSVGGLCTHPEFGGEEAERRFIKRVLRTRSPSHYNDTDRDWEPDCRFLVKRA